MRKRGHYLTLMDMHNYLTHAGRLVLCETDEQCGRPVIKRRARGGSSQEDNRVELIVIGSGTGVPSLRRGSPALAVRAAGRLLLLDLGAGTLRSMLRQGLNFNQIDILALSHRHPDHVGDLVPFLFATRYALGYTRREPFWLLAARGFAGFLERLKSAFGDWLEPPAGLLQLRELSPDGPMKRLGRVCGSRAPPPTILTAAWPSAWRPGPVPWSIPGTRTKATPWWPWPGGPTSWCWRRPTPSRSRGT